MSHLFSERVNRGKVSVSLAVNSRIRTATDSIHFPVRVVVIYNVEIPMPTPASTKHDTCILVVLMIFTLTRHS
ncbi:hypothetical protein Hanom_Chr15g01350271 [Helianthus anomalus]